LFSEIKLVLEQEINEKDVVNGRLSVVNGKKKRCE
jgi:hypothetical protein